MSTGTTHFEVIEKVMDPTCFLSQLCSFHTALEEPLRSICLHEHSTLHFEIAQISIAGQLARREAVRDRKSVATRQCSDGLDKTST